MTPQDPFKDDDIPSGGASPGDPDTTQPEVFTPAPAPGGAPLIQDITKPANPSESNQLDTAQQNTEEDKAINATAKIGGGTHAKAKSPLIAIAITIAILLIIGGIAGLVLFSGS